MDNFFSLDTYSDPMCIVSLAPPLPFVPLVPLVPIVPFVLAPLIPIAPRVPLSHVNSVKSVNSASSLKRRATSISDVILLLLKIEKVILLKRHFNVIQYKSRMLASSSIHTFSTSL